MSYCELIFFKDDKPYDSMEFKNSWGGCAFIWTSMFDKYVKDETIPYHSWLSDKSNKLWMIVRRRDLPMDERLVLAFTFDIAFVRKEHFLQFASALRSFALKYPAGNMECHLIAWAEVFEKSTEEAIALRGTSCSENQWYAWDEKTEEEIPRTLSEIGGEIFDNIQSYDNQPYES